jgi:DNA helicase-2/ATP-dependent DNA helicase PcrA
VASTSQRCRAYGPNSVGLAAEVEEGLLTLSTIHSAKGLEWHTVFVLWLVDGRFPSYHNLHESEEVEEERRLLYDRASGMVLGQPSRFLEGLPSNLLAGVQVVEGQLG